MQNTRTVLVVYQTCRHFSICCAKYKNYASRESNMLDKLIHKNSRRKQFIPHGSFLKSVGLGLEEKGPSSHVLRRKTVLNKIYMEHITNIMTNSSVCAEFIKKDIEISHVKITNDFKFLNIFWNDDCEDTEESMNVQERLNKYAKELRYELCQLRVIGNVPALQFVRCKNSSMQMEVEKRLKEADFGEDYIPSFRSHNSEDIVTHIYTSAVKSAENDESIFAVRVPEMRHDVLGLNHSRIMDQIRASLKKSEKAKNRMLNKKPQSDVIDDTYSLADVSFMSEQQQEEKFKKFLHQRERQKRIRIKQIKLAKQQSMNINEDVIIEDNDETDRFDVLDKYFEECPDKEIQETYGQHNDE